MLTNTTRFSNYDLSYVLIRLSCYNNLLGTYEGAMYHPDNINVLIFSRLVSGIRSCVEIPPDIIDEIDSDPDGIEEQLQRWAEKASRID